MNTCYTLSPFFFHVLPFPSRIFRPPSDPSTPASSHTFLHPIQDSVLPYSSPGSNTHLALPTPNPTPDSCLHLLGVISMLKLMFTDGWVTARAVQDISFIFLTLCYGNFQTYTQQREKYSEPPCTHCPASTIVNGLSLFFLLFPIFSWSILKQILGTIPLHSCWPINISVCSSNRWAPCLHIPTIPCSNLTKLIIP